MKTKELESWEAEGDRTKGHRRAPGERLRPVCMGQHQILQDRLERSEKAGGDQGQISHPILYATTSQTIILNTERILKSVQDTLGHEDIQTTQIYLQTTFRKHRKQVKKVFGRCGQPRPMNLQKMKG